MCGLFIDPDFPYLRGYPDALVQCKCCGEGLFLRRGSLMRNLLSAIISSPGRIRSKNPKSLVMYVSDTFPPYSFETYVMAPDGEKHTRALKVLCCLYELNVCDWAVRFLGFFMKNSVQSVMLVTFGKLSRNDPGQNRFFYILRLPLQNWCEHKSHIVNPCGDYL